MADIGGMPMKISKSVKSAIENASFLHEFFHLLILILSKAVNLLKRSLSVKVADLKLEKMAHAMDIWTGNWYKSYSVK